MDNPQNTNADESSNAPPPFNPNYVENTDLAHAEGVHTGGTPDDPPNVSKRLSALAATVGTRANELNKKHQILERSKSAANVAMQKAKELDEKHQIVDKSKRMAQGAMQKAKEVDEKHHVVDKSKGAAKQMMDKAKEIDEKHQVVDKTKKAAESATKSVAAGVAFLSKYMETKKTTPAKVD